MKSPFDPEPYEDMRARVEPAQQQWHEKACQEVENTNKRRIEYYERKVEPKYRVIEDPETGKNTMEKIIPYDLDELPTYEFKECPKWVKVNKSRKNIANRIDKLLKLEFLNKMDRRLNWANRSKTALYTTRVKALQHCIAEFEKELRKEEIE